MPINRRDLNTRKYSKNQENKVAKTLKGKRQPNSGATAFSKGDVQTDQFLIECKTATTLKKSIGIKSDWIDKLKEEVFAMGKYYWAVAFNFGGLQNKENYYIIDEQLFKKLKTYLEEDL
jgi:hypothetical protein